LYDIRPGNGAVYSYNPGAHTGRLMSGMECKTALFKMSLTISASVSILHSATGGYYEYSVTKISLNI